MISQSLDAQHLSEHPSPARLRVEAWMALQRAAERLEEAPGDGTAEREEVRRGLEMLAGLEAYWARPGADEVRHLMGLLDGEDPRAVAGQVLRSIRALAVDPARPSGQDDRGGAAARVPSVTALLVDALEPDAARRLRARMVALRTPDDDAHFDLLVVPSFEDAVFAASFNHEVQACVIRDGFPLASQASLPRLEPLQRLAGRLDEDGPAGRALRLGGILGELRPELDLYLFTDVPVDRLPAATHRVFRRVFYRQDPLVELHLSLLEGLRRRVEAPFFEAVRRHSRRPVGVFHALPISRGGSVASSPWTRDMTTLYGMGLFMAETSATSGGLDSLLRPRGALRAAQDAASRAFGSDASWFVTNGTSTANKIVVEALTEPGDIVLVDRSCHKSHHHALVHSGAHPAYLDGYELRAYSIYGAVTVATVKRALLDLRRAGRLDRVRLLILTNCTFDGLVYDPLRVMEEALAIAPQLCFLWDEAWFAAAVASPTYRRRTAMHAAARLRERLAAPELREVHRRQRRALAGADDERLVAERLVPDPAASVRVYATQSTHKSLSALRQGSMIHVRDDAFGRLARVRFEDAYMSHTSTSPNYQILASLDVARRQLELEGYALVQAAIEKSVCIRRTVAADPVLSGAFRVLGVPDLIPRDLSPVLQGATGRSAEEDAFRIERGWASDELVLDPTRITLFVGGLGIDGATFRDRHLMGRLGVQVNKTSPNTVLVMTGIGTTWSSVAFLLDGLRRLARELGEEACRETPPERERRERRRRRLTEELPALPPFSGFAARFRPHKGSAEGDLRAAHALGMRPGTRRHVPLAEVAARARRGEELVSAGFVTPYPPGFPMLVPGQVVDLATAELLARVDVDEIHGYEPELGLAVLRAELHGGAPPGTAAADRPAHPMHATEAR